MRRIAFITESTSRKEEPTKACDFYHSPKSRWVSYVINYMKVRDLPAEDIFFVSFYHQRLIGFEEVVENYPRLSKSPGRKEQQAMAEVIMQLLSTIDEPFFVELHAGKNIVDPLKPLLEEKGIAYRTYADSAALAEKPKVYALLIEEEQNRKRLKEMQREKWLITSQCEYRTVEEANRIIQEYGNKAQFHDVEALIEELKAYAEAHHKRSVSATKALKEAEGVIEQTGDYDLLDFINSKQQVSHLFTNEYEQYKSKYGKEIAKYTRYLLKKEFVKEMDNKISSCLLKLQIALLKGA